MGEMRVDLQHLLEDLRDAYPGGLEETILTEAVANSLDSGARRIRLHSDPSAATLTIVDDGSGMKRRDLARYHDLAASTKARGRGIGFAGVGIKLALLLCTEVVTETRRGASHAATTWHLASRHKAPWKWLAPPPGLAGEGGTAVRLKLANPLSPLLDAGFVEATIRRHFEPLFDAALDEVLRPLYPHAVALEVDGRPLDRRTVVTGDRVPIAIRLQRKRKAAALGWLARDSVPFAEERRGVAVSTYGKVIKRGWDWLGMTPVQGDRVSGLIEAPALAECLTLNKGDFIRTGARGSIYLSYRRAIQEAVVRQLAEWGEPGEAAESGPRRAARPVERDLEEVLVDLADDFPMLASLVERRLGGQRKLPIGKPGAALGAAAFLAASVARGTASPSAEGLAASPPQTGDAEAAPATPPPPGRAPGLAAPTGGTKLPVRYGLAIQFRSRPGDEEIAQLVDTVVWVNEAHPAYRRATLSRSEGYHLALAVALALAPLAAEPSGQLPFVMAFLARWGESVERPRRRGRRRPQAR